VPLQGFSSCFVAMKHSILLTFLLVGLLIACTEKPTQETTTTTPDTLAQQKAAFETYSDKFKKIIKTEDGILRGVNFGDNLEEVIVKEDTIPLEDSTQYISFTVKLDEEEDEITDVLYFFDKNRQIKGFRLDIYLNNTSAVDSLSQEFTTYFTDRYGKPVMQEQKAKAWNGLDQTKIVMKDVGIKEAPGLQIQIGRNM
jgi:hypothetical protein